MVGGSMGGEFWAVRGWRRWRPGVIGSRVVGVLVCGVYIVVCLPCFILWFS